MTRSAVAWTALGLILALAVTCEGPRIHAWGNDWSHHEDRTPLRAVARLDCPETEGHLTRASAAADGRLCVYRSENGSEVELRLAALDGREPAALLGPIEAELRVLVPPPPAAKPVAGGARTSVEGEAVVDLPGLHIRADDEKARIQLPGIDINADDDRAHIRTTEGKGGTVIVNAAEEGAEIRSRRNDDKGVRESYLLAREDAPAGSWHAVGYEARGPKGGPLVIAVVRQREDGDAFDDAKELVERNSGG